MVIWETGPIQEEVSEQKLTNMKSDVKVHQKQKRFTLKR